MKSAIFVLCIFLAACCGPAGYKYHQEGAQEFVLDSYRIKQGKFSILEMEGECMECLPSHYLQEYEDVIDNDDILVITMQHPIRRDLCESVNGIGCRGVRVISGAICLPEAGTIQVKGLTFPQAQAKIREAFSAEISNVDIFLEYATRAHSKVELIGEVGVKQIPVNGRIRLFEVLSLASVSPNSNLFKSYVLRGDTILPVDLSRLILQGDMSQNIVMYPGDKIFIANAAAANVMVMGEVGIASVVPVPTGSISLREALAASGGIPFTGDKRCIQVIRGNILNPKIYRLSWNHITFLPNDSLLLMPGDTVYISETPITKWNRFINQLLPSSMLIDFGVKCRGVCGW
ncbi:MAG: sugar transporter [Chlamydiales bacterium]|nr:sugar transporter [Chlamydiales bacterium]